MPQPRLKLLMDSICVVENMSHAALKATIGPDDSVSFDKDKWRAATDRVREACLKYVALDHPMTDHLKFAMAVLRVGHDYERLFELTSYFRERMVELADVNHESLESLRAAAHAAIVLHGFLSAHASDMSYTAFSEIDDGSKQAAAVARTWVENTQSKIKESMTHQDISAEQKIQMVLAARHIKRIVMLISEIMDEWRFLKLEVHQESKAG